MLSIAAVVSATACAAGLWACAGNQFEHAGPGAARVADPEAVRAHELPRVIEGYRDDKNKLLELPRWALALCDARTFKDINGVQQPHMSAGDDIRSHGQRMAVFFASPLQEYAGLRHVDAKTPAALPEGQYVVKETWRVKEVELKDVPQREHEVSELYVIEKDRAWKRTERSETFVMYKPPEGSAMATETDAGWVYAVLTPDARTVVESGKIERCMSCHQGAPHERLFGPPWALSPVSRPSAEPR
jgi:hypothetical protein